MRTCLFSVLMFKNLPKILEGTLFKFNGIPSYHCNLSRSSDWEHGGLPIGAFQQILKLIQNQRWRDVKHFSIFCSINSSNTFQTSNWVKLYTCFSFLFPPPYASVFLSLNFFSFFSFFIFYHWVYFKEGPLYPPHICKSLSPESLKLVSSGWGTSSMMIIVS